MFTFEESAFLLVNIFRPFTNFEPRSKSLSYNEIKQRDHTKYSLNSSETYALVVINTEIRIEILIRKLIWTYEIAGVADMVGYLRINFVIEFVYT